MGYYNEHPTMVGRSICKSWFFGLRTLRRNLQTDFGTLNVIMMLGGSARDITNFYFY